MSAQHGKVESGPRRGMPRVVVSCDAGGCRASEAIEPAATFDYARMMVGRRRWRYVLLKRSQGGPARSIDLCPEHADTPVEEMPTPISPHWTGKRGRASNRGSWGPR